MLESTSRAEKANLVAERSDRDAPAPFDVTGNPAKRPARTAKKRTIPAPIIPAPIEVPRDEMPPAPARLQLGARVLRVVCVDDVVPKHVASRTDSRARLVYSPGEVTHFELDGHRYALVREEDQSNDAHALTGAAPHAADDFRARLTNRELQIVQFISMGCLAKQVSERLHISEFTVRSYLKTIYCKLGVRSRGALVYRYAQSFKRPGEPP